MIYFGKLDISENFKWKKLIKKVKEESFSKGTGKGNVWKQTPQEAAGHNSGPPKQTYYCGSGLLMDYPLDKLVGCCFLIGCKKASYIFGKLGICESFKWKKLRKQFIKRKKALAKEKDRRNVWKISPQEAAGHNSGPPNKHTIVDQSVISRERKSQGIKWKKLRK